MFSPATPVGHRRRRRVSRRTLAFFHICSANFWCAAAATRPLSSSRTDRLLRHGHGHDDDERAGSTLIVPADGVVDEDEEQLGETSRMTPAASETRETISNLVRARQKVPHRRGPPPSRAFFKAASSSEGRNEDSDPHTTPDAGTSFLLSQKDGDSTAAFEWPTANASADYTQQNETGNCFLHPLWTPVADNSTYSNKADAEAAAVAHCSADVARCFGFTIRTVFMAAVQQEGFVPETWSVLRADCAPDTAANETTTSYAMSWKHAVLYHKMDLETNDTDAGQGLCFQERYGDELSAEADNATAVSKAIYWCNLNAAECGGFSVMAEETKTVMADGTSNVGVLYYPQTWKEVSPCQNDPATTTETKADGATEEITLKTISYVNTQKYPLDTLESTLGAGGDGAGGNGAGAGVGAGGDGAGGDGAGGGGAGGDGATTPAPAEQQNHSAPDQLWQTVGDSWSKDEFFDFAGLGVSFDLRGEGGTDNHVTSGELKERITYEFLGTTINLASAERGANGLRELMGCFQYVDDSFGAHALGIGCPNLEGSAEAPRTCSDVYYLKEPLKQLEAQAHSNATGISSLALLAQDKDGRDRDPPVPNPSPATPSPNPRTPPNPTTPNAMLAVSALSDEETACAEMPSAARFLVLVLNQDVPVKLKISGYNKFPADYMLDGVSKTPNLQGEDLDKTVFAYFDDLPNAPGEDVCRVDLGEGGAPLACRSSQDFTTSASSATLKQWTLEPGLHRLTVVAGHDGVLVTGVEISQGQAQFLRMSTDPAHPVRVVWRDQD